MSFATWVFSFTKIVVGLPEETYDDDYGTL
jgi:hypothetical protein